MQIRGGPCEGWGRTESIGAGQTDRGRGRQTGRGGAGEEWKKNSKKLGPDWRRCNKSLKGATKDTAGRKKTRPGTQVGGGTDGNGAGPAERWTEVELTLRL